MDIRIVLHHAAQVGDDIRAQVANEVAGLGECIAHQWQLVAKHLLGKHRIDGAEQAIESVDHHDRVVEEAEG